MRRRQAVLALLLFVLVALSGCADPSGSIELRPVEDLDLAEELSRPTTGGSVYPAIREQQVVSEAIENGSITVATLRESVDETYYYRHEGHYYDISAESKGEVPGLELSIGVDRNASDPKGPRLTFSELSTTDKGLLRPFLEHEPHELQPGPDAEFPAVIRASSREDSTLLDHAGSSVVLDYRDETLRLLVGELDQDQIRLYRYETTKIADNTTAYEAYLMRQYAFTISEPSDKERDVLDAAMGDSYYAESTDDSGFDAVVDRFRRHRAIRAQSGSGTWLVRYQETTYLADLYYGLFVDDETITTETPAVTPH